jgi:large subunit ribosomal protein L1
MKRGKKYKKIFEKLNHEEVLSLEEGIKKVKGNSYTSFNGSIELHVALNLPKDTDAKSVKGAVALPHSVGGKGAKVAVFTTPDRDEEATKAGADFVGIEKLTKDVKAGKIEFDVAIATPSVMPKIASLGKELGPKGLMPNPKNGTVTDDIATAVGEYKQGKQKFACDEGGVIHFVVGKMDMEGEKIAENIHKAMQVISETLGKGINQLIKTVHLAPTMGPSVKIEYVKE